MEENKEKKWVLYCHTTPSWKKYFGVTSQDVNQRWRRGKGYKGSVYFYRAIQKYGWDNIEHEIIACDLTKDQAMELEKAYIAAYRTNEPDYGYNLTDGGEGSPGHAVNPNSRKPYGEVNTRPVCQFDLKMHLVSEYNNIKEASRAVGIDDNRIRSCCKRKGNIRTAAGYFWIFKDELDSINFDEYIAFAESQKVFKYSLDLELLDIYDNTIEASKVNDISFSEICRALKSGKQYCGGFIWTRYGQSPTNKYVGRGSTNYSLKIDQYSLDGSFIKTFNSLRGAKKELETTFTKIRTALYTSPHILEDRCILVVSGNNLFD